MKTFYIIIALVLLAFFGSGQNRTDMFEADKDVAFDNGSGIQIGKLSSGATENLALTGKIWGFLKYYHPAIASGKYNWDYELFRILPTVLDAKTKDQRNASLLSWVKKLGPVQTRSYEEVNKADIKSKPDLAWINNKKDLGEALSSNLQQVLIADRKPESYYFGPVPGVGNPEFKNERDYASMKFPDDGFRLLALYRYWNMVNYFFPYKYLINENWDKVLEEFIPKFLQAKDETEYALSVLSIIARINDTHANITNNNALFQYQGRKIAPLQTRFIEDRLVVTGFYTDKEYVKKAFKPGDIITKIDGARVEDLIKKYLPLTPASNYSAQLRDLPNNWLMRTNNAEMILEVESDGNKTNVLVLTEWMRGLNYKIDYDPNPDKPGFYMLESGIAYLFPGKYYSRDLDSIKKTFKDSKGMIIDMRCYPSEFMPFSFGSYVKKKTSTFVKFVSNNYERPGLFTFKKTIKNGGGSGEKYHGKIVILVNERTQSQGEYTTMAFQNQKNVTVVGSTTAAADGNVSRIILPGGIRTAFSGIGVYYPDGTETQRIGIKIDVPCKPSIAGIKAGRDEPLEKAKEIILQEK